MIPHDIHDVSYEDIGVIAAVSKSTNLVQGSGVIQLAIFLSYKSAKCVEVMNTIIIKPGH